MQSPLLKIKFVLLSRCLLLTLKFVISIASLSDGDDAIILDLVYSSPIIGSLAYKALCVLSTNSGSGVPYSTDI
jgi:hypothetical protein